MSRPVTHGMTGTSEYRAWQGMKARCFNSDHKRYGDYGGRGITISNSWLNSFENFFSDMGLKPSSKHSIDRIDNNGNYSAENCRWSTKKDQANNRRSNHLITIGCVTLNIMQWTKEMGFSVNIIWSRLENGWSEFDAVMTPVGGKSKMITIENETRTIPQWTTKMRFTPYLIYDRLKMGWSEYDAVMTPVETGRLITIRNETRTIPQWTTKMCFNRTLIQGRLGLGWSEYDAVMTPARFRPKSDKNITQHNR